MFQYLNQPNTAPVAQPMACILGETICLPDQWQGECFFWLVSTEITLLRTNLKTYFTLGNVNLANGKVTNLNGYKK